VRRGILHDAGPPASADAVRRRPRGARWQRAAGRPRRCAPSPSSRPGGRSYRAVPSRR
jgi:hypothetical protein